MADFKEDFHNLSTHVKKYATSTWHKLTLLVTENDIMGVFSKWPSNWLTPSEEGARTSKVVEGEVEEIIAMTVAVKEKKKEVNKASMK